MPKSAKSAAVVELSDAPKPWTTKKPPGLYVCPQPLSKGACVNAWQFFHPTNSFPEGAVDDKTGKPRSELSEFPWYQRFKRFPKTAHHNGWHSGEYRGEEGMAKLQEDWPVLHATAMEALEMVKAAVPDEAALEGFLPESIAVMRHKPGWGLGRHFDNAHDAGKGAVLMLTFSDDDTVPRVFKFSCPPLGLEYPVETLDGQAIFFTGDCYDLWAHESLHNEKQSGECISLTIRMADVCGYRVTPGASPYKPGAPAAKKVAHERIDAKRKAEASEAVAKPSKKAKKASKAEASQPLTSTTIDDVRAHLEASKA